VYRSRAAPSRIVCNHTPERLRLRKGELVDFVETVFDVSDYITPTTDVVDDAAPLDDTAADSIIAGLNFDHSDSDSD
jgi:hypothetical protein